MDEVNQENQINFHVDIYQANLVSLVVHFAYVYRYISTDILMISPNLCMPYFLFGSIPRLISYFSFTTYPCIPLFHRRFIGLF